MSIKTKFGNVSLSKKGYYVVHTLKEGNRGKRLHRLIWEDFYGCEIPKGYVIHHKNGIKTDNCILNLQLMREDEHNSFHNIRDKHPMYGRHHSESSKNKIKEASLGRLHSLDSKLSISKKNGDNKYFRVMKVKLKNREEWIYRYMENGERIKIKSDNLEDLKQKVLERGLEWIKLD